MPFLTISTLLLLFGVFGCGWLAAWYVTDRRHERQRALLEETMMRELEQRYHVYQDLEQSFHRVFRRLDEMKAHWMESSELVMPAHSLMRVENPELWDLEREYERKHADALAEISDKSRRVVELMERIETLEVMSQQLAERDREFVQMEENQRALEETRRARVADLTQRVEELESVEGEVEELRGQVEQAGEDVRNWRDKHDSLYLRSTEDQARLKQELEALQQQLEEQVARGDQVESANTEQLEDLKSQIVRREERLEEVCAEVEQLKSDVEFRDSQLFMRDELVKERDKQVAEISEELSRARTERDRKIEELSARDARLEELERAWGEANGQVAAQRSKLMHQLSSFQTAQSMLSQLKPMLDALESNLTVEEQTALDDVHSKAEEAPEVEESEQVEDREEVAQTEPMSVDELPSALPAESETVDATPTEEFDLSVLDGDEEDDFGPSRDVE
jgi:chromosome segregation ATPase